MRDYHIAECKEIFTLRFYESVHYYPKTFFHREFYSPPF